MIGQSNPGPTGCLVVPAPPEPAWAKKPRVGRTRAARRAVQGRAASEGGWREQGPQPRTFGKAGQEGRPRPPGKTAEADTRHWPPFSHKRRTFARSIPSWRATGPPTV